MLLKKKSWGVCFLLKKFDSTSNIFSTHNLLNVNSIHKYFLLISVFKTIKKPDSQIFSIIEHQRVTRENNANLKIPRFQTSLYRNSIACFGPRAWNTLPINLKILIFTCNFSTFKRKWKKICIWLTEWIEGIFFSRYYWCWGFKSR